MLKSLLSAHTFVPSNNTPLIFNHGMLSETLRVVDAELTSPRTVGWVHVSDLLDFCARKFALVERHSIDLTKSASGPMRVVWAMGRAAETHIRNQLIRAFNYQNVIGEWSCGCGSMINVGFCNNIKTCHRCGTKAVNYGEFSLKDESLMLVGHPDLLLWVDGEVLPVEIKSVKANPPPSSRGHDESCFKSLQAAPLDQPLPDHAFQLTAYAKLLRARNTLPISDKGIVLYVSKDFGFTTPYLEKHISTSEGITSRLVDDAFYRVGELRQQQKSNALPERLRACSSSSSTKAKNCVACTSCFSV